MKKENDIVDDIFTRVKAILGDEFKGQIVVMLEDEEIRIRKDWGGTEPYISKKMDIEKRKAIALEKLKEGKSLKEAARQAEICETYVHMLRKRIYKM